LIQALQTADLPSEALAVIEAGKVRPIREGASTARGVEENVPEVLDPPRTVSVSKEQNLQANGSPKLAPRGLVPLSVRVQAGLADSLLKVAFERRLQRLAPHSQQDIVTQAVRQWLKRNGYATGEE
jgi:hypothetical protein